MLVVVVVVLLVGVVVVGVVLVGVVVVVGGGAVGRDGGDFTSGDAGDSSSCGVLLVVRS